MISLLVATATFAPFTVSGTIADGNKLVGDAVVWLKGEAHGTPVKASIEQKNKRFTPHVLVVPVGSTVDFPNRDDLFHNVFAEYDAKKFDLGMFGKGQTRGETFKKPGMVSVLCNVHSNMSAFIMVVDTPYFAKTNAKGQFEIKNVPAGTYDMEAWHESGKKSSGRVVVNGNETVTIKLERG